MKRESALFAGGYFHAVSTKYLQLQIFHFFLECSIYIFQYSSIFRRRDKLLIYFQFFPYFSFFPIFFSKFIYIFFFRLFDFVSIFFGIFSQYSDLIVLSNFRRRDISSVFSIIRFLNDLLCVFIDFSPIFFRFFLHNCTKFFRVIHPLTQGRGKFSCCINEIFSQA